MPKRLPFRKSHEYSTFELAAYLGITRGALLQWLRRGLIEEPARRGNKRIWTRAQADALRMTVGA